MKPGRLRTSICREGWSVCRVPRAAAIGRVTVAGFIESRARKVLIDLPEADYTTAIRAHEEEAIVLCTGELVKEGRSFQRQDTRSAISP